MVRSLLVELLGRIKTCSSRPSYHATLGQNLGIRQGLEVQGNSGNWPEDLEIHRERESIIRGFRYNSLVLI